MTTAQALMRGLPAAPAKSEAPDAAGSEADDNAFGDALETAFLAALEGIKSGETSQPATGEKAPQDEATDDAPVLSAESPGSAVTSASLALAVLQGAAANAEPGVQPAPRLVQILAMPTEEMPAGEAETIDASQLLKALGSEAAGKTIERVETAGTEVTEDVTLKVLRRETHLAIVRTPAVLSQDLAGAPASGAGAAQQVESQAAQLARELQRATGDAAPEQAAEDTGPNAPVSGKAWGPASEKPAHREFGQQAPADGQLPNGGAGNGDGLQSSTFAMPLQAGRTAETAVDDGLADPAYETPAEQISTAVRSEVAVETEELSTDGAVKVLQIELKPASLGAVTVRIALKDNAVTVHLEAQRADTLEAIERDREALAGSLRSAGYTVDSITSSVQSDAGRLNSVLSGGLDAGYSGSQSGSQGSPMPSPGQGHAGSSGQGMSGGAGQQNNGRASGKGSESGALARNGADGLYV